MIPIAIGIAGVCKDRVPSVHKSTIIVSDEKQVAFFENYFDEWKGQLEQVDDVCLMGIAI